jgi:hypothetical protein
VSSSFYQWVVFLCEGEMSFGAELEIEVTLSPLPPLLDLLDSVPPYHNSSPLESKPRGISLLEGKILWPDIQRIK